MTSFLTNKKGLTKQESSAKTEAANLFLKRNKLYLSLFIAGMILITAVTSRMTRFSLADGFAAVPKVLAWSFRNFFPDAKAWERLPKMLEKMVDTVFMSIMSSVTAAVFALIFALLGSATTRLNRFFGGLSRGIALIFRNIPVVAWAMIFILTFGQSTFTGFLALFFTSFGLLTRFFMETIDEASVSTVEALRASGASYPQIIAQGVIPSTLPQLVSWILYMIEVNIRSATLVGLLTGSGIGFIFDLYYKSLQYKSASLLVFLIMAVVLLIEFISNTLRRKIL
ncbi:MAG: phosphonate ABC transporter, permease protein PhnE [Spirochaetales bacterium]|nr:phosphonate ABC transporter, permease protein PhnE [Spirochaetales bacterium]